MHDPKALEAHTLSSRLRRSRCGWALSVYVAAVLSAQGVAAQPTSEIAGSAWQQMGTIAQLKRSRTPAQRKLDTRLHVEVLRQQRNPALGGLPALRTGVEVDGRGTVQVDMRAEVTPELLGAIESLGGTVSSAFPRWHAVRARVPLAQIETLAARPEVAQIRPADVMRTDGNVVITEGDTAHRANVARTNFSVDGTGVAACAMSDSVDALAALQASGELPPGVTVLSGQSGNPGTSEGTALLEIIHDLAPGASLIFATGQGGTAQMAQNILDLATAGCDVIADDVFYFAEPPFQDGVIAQAVDQVSAAGVLYFSSAGNSGRLNAGTSGVWEGPFAAGTLPPPLVGAALAAHDFGGGLVGNQLTEQALNDAPFFTLWWSNPLGGADDDYDLFLLDNALANVIAFSANTQDGDDDPLEAINSVGVSHTGNRLVVTKFSGADQFLQLNTHRGILQLGTDGQITGHAGAESAFAVAAVDVDTAGGGPFVGGATNPVEPFSSDGPRRIFFNPDGSPAAVAVGPSRGPNFITRNKPDVTAADGVMTTTPGFMTFFGTSASVPHTAGISALLKQINPNLTPSQLRQILAFSSLDIENPGFDFDSGHGILDAQEAAERADFIFADGFESGNTSAWSNTVP